MYIVYTLYICAIVHLHFKYEQRLISLYFRKMNTNRNSLCAPVDHLVCPCGVCISLWGPELQLLGLLALGRSEGQRSRTVCLLLKVGVWRPQGVSPCSFQAPL